MSYFNSYPSYVSIANDLHNIGWKIECLSIKSDDHICSNSKQKHLTPFWINQKWADIIIWVMFSCLLILCSIGYCISYLKNRSRRLHRLAMQRSRMNGNGNDERENRRRNHNQENIHVDFQRMMNQVQQSIDANSEILSESVHPNVRFRKLKS